MEAVLGGMLVMGIGYVIYGLLAPRFEVGTDTRSQAQMAA